MTRRRWFLVLYGSIGLLSAIGDKVTEATAWPDIAVPNVVIFGLLGLANGIAAFLTPAKKAGE